LIEFSQSFSRVLAGKELNKRKEQLSISESRLWPANDHLNGAMIKAISMQKYLDNLNKHEPFSKRIA